VALSRIVSRLDYLTDEYTSRLNSNIDTFYELIVNDAMSSAPVRVPTDLNPISRLVNLQTGASNPFLTNDVTCNKIGTPASETRVVSPGDQIGFHVANTSGYPYTLAPGVAFVYHKGPMAFYVAQPPDRGEVKDWDGKNGSWIKASFQTMGEDNLLTTLPPPLDCPVQDNISSTGVCFDGQIKSHHHNAQSCFRRGELDRLNQITDT